MFSFTDHDLTEISVLLDRSGSMQAVHNETVEGFGAFVEKQKQLKGSCRLTLNQFDTVYETVYRNRLIERVPRLQFFPRGATALLDAMGKCITDQSRRVDGLPAARQAVRTIFVIITDGLENSSREFTRDQVFSLVRQCTETRDWQFVYLGANQDAIREASRMGIDGGAALNFAGTPIGTLNAWEATGAAIGRHRGEAGRRVAGSYFTREERNNAMG